MGLTPDMLRYVDVCVLFASLCADVCVRGAGRGVWGAGPGVSVRVFQSVISSK